MRRDGYGTLSVCVCVHSANLRPQSTRQPNSDTNSLSATWTLFFKRGVFPKTVLLQRGFFAYRGEVGYFCLPPYIQLYVCMYNNCIVTLKAPPFS